MGNITVRALKFFAFHGCHPGEANTGGPFEVDISVDIDFSKVQFSDDINDAVNYVALMEIASAQMQVRRNLIETVANSIGTEVKKRFPQSGRVEVCVRKMAVPVSFEHEYVSATVVIE